MSTPGSPPTTDGMYSQLIEDEGTFDDYHLKPDVGHSVFPVRQHTKLSGPGPYRVATICLATLCAVLLISIIAVTAQYKNNPRSGDEATSEMQKQMPDANMSALTSTIKKLQQEKKQLEKEKEELVAKLAATKAPKAKPTPAQITCPVDWRLFGNSCYLISTLSKGWQASQSFCQTHGAHLAIIHTAEEQTFLWNLLPRGHWNSYWFGITDEHTEDQWKWVDGTPLVGGFWEVGEPNNHINEDCGYIVKTQVLERVAIRSWYDAPCSMYLPFICEKEMNTSTSTP